MENFDREYCECGACDWSYSATLIACKNCGLTWGRCNGVWKLDPESSFRTRIAKAAEEHDNYTLHAVSRALSNNSPLNETLVTACIAVADDNKRLIAQLLRAAKLDGPVAFAAGREEELRLELQRNKEEWAQKDARSAAAVTSLHSLVTWAIARLQRNSDDEGANYLTRRLEETCPTTPSHTPRL